MTRLDGLHGQVAIIGSGIAGLMAALELAPRPVVLITRSGLGQESSSAWAQGGIAAALSADDDVALHLADTLAAGDGLCNADVAAGILSETGDAIAALEHHGVAFDRTESGTFSFGREAAHSRRRILHIGGDGTGAGITSALVRAVQNCPSVTCLTGVDARRLMVRNGRIVGVHLQDDDGAAVLHTGQVIMATGGCAGLFDASTNPSGNFGAGLAMALHAGAAVRDMEFMQFHPTALATTRAPLALISEAVRGESATLIDQNGRRFMSGTPGAELAPRDVVARAVHRVIADGGRAYLDARKSLGARFKTRFPGIHAMCQADGIDPAVDPIPVRPAAHYHMGGIAVDRQGRSTVPGLWAIGECAATGLHGANRLASNSLLEAVVMGRRAAGDVAGQDGFIPSVETEPPVLQKASASTLHPVISRELSVTRNGVGLERAISWLEPYVHAGYAASDPALVALSVAVFADLRRESRGGHYRSDHPEPALNPRSNTMTLTEILTHAQSANAQSLLKRPA
ncbi:L-aspartate oxidase [Tropicibacter sp. R16_0]|uniref:L-aspartate oxidase n=1 Tax=Tropicibacter sp. R16_0 TaxID=2821102 RepID=UPI001ADAAA29|nr:L-aspartate oxidase [Tropicibacter sp. R16_0]MBO9451187.1 L-aspartate oxidase [Tropicibacter sp. R16_0]